MNAKQIFGLIIAALGCIRIGWLVSKWRKEDRMIAAAQKEQIRQAREFQTKWLADHKWRGPSD